MRRLPILLLALMTTVLLTAADHAETTAPVEHNMTLGQAVVLGVVEGLTEYLPVSSTGHLLLAQRAMGIDQTDAANAYAICIQAGAIMAVLGLYFEYIKSMFRGLLGKDDRGRRLLINLVVAFLPAAVVGLLFVDTIMSTLFGLWPIVIAWFVGGVAILVVAWSKKGTPQKPGKDLSELSWKQALMIGVLQCIAIWPGTSRSLVTIVGGVLVGMNLRSSVIFSFLLGAFTLTAATLYSAVDQGFAMLHSFGALNIMVGFAVATLAAMVAVKWMVAYLKRHGLALFGYYRVAIALIVGALLVTGVMVSG